MKAMKAMKAMKVIWAIRCRRVFTAPTFIAQVWPNADTTRHPNKPLFLNSPC